MAIQFSETCLHPLPHHHSPSSLSEEKGGLVSDAYGEDDFSRLGGDEDGYEEEEDENSKQSVGKSSRSRAV